MKNKNYFSCLVVLATLLAGCQKEQVVPAAVAQEEASVAKIVPVACTSYSYQTKTSTEQLGTAGTAEIFVGFDNSLTVAQKVAILSQYKPFKAIAYEMATESGLLTVVSLKPNTSCQQVDEMLQQLETEVSVRYALPTFTNVSFWDEFFVVLSNSGTERQLLQMVASTNTRIVGDPSLYGPKTYLLSADKNSTGNVFAMLTYFNASSRVAFAEPAGFIYPLPNKVVRNRLAIGHKSAVPGI